MSGKGDKRRPGEGYGEAYERIFGKKLEDYNICVDCLEEVTQIRQLDEVLDWCGDCGRIVEGNTLKCIREIEK